MPWPRWIRASSEEPEGACARRPARLHSRRGRLSACAPSCGPCRLVAGATTGEVRLATRVRTGCAVSTSSGTRWHRCCRTERKLAERDSGSATGGLRCALTVDKRPASSVVEDVLNMDADPFRRRGQVSHAGEGRRAEGRCALPGIRIMDRFAPAVKECVYQGSPRKCAVLAELGESKPAAEDVADHRKALKEFINGFVPSALETQDCS